MQGRGHRAQRGALPEWGGAEGQQGGRGRRPPGADPRGDLTSRSRGSGHLRWPGAYPRGLPVGCRSCPPCPGCPDKAPQAACPAQRKFASSRCPRPQVQEPGVGAFGAPVLGLQRLSRPCVFTASLCAGLSLCPLSPFCEDTVLWAQGLPETPHVNSVTSEKTRSPN